MKIIQVNNDFKEKWDNFLIQNNCSFLQSWVWGEICQKKNQKIWRLVCVDDINENKIYNQFLVIQNKMSYGFNWIYIPRPKYSVNSVGDEKNKINEEKAFELLLQNVLSLAKQNKSIFVYIDLYEQQDFLKDKIKSTFKKLGFKERQNHSIQPISTVIIDLKQTQEEILSKMNQKTRYNIKLAQKKQIQISFQKDNKAIQDFYELQKMVAKRQNIKVHSFEHYKNIIQSENFFLVSAVVNGKTIASNIMNVFANTAVYLHGASDYNYRDLMATYLLQWEAILFAKNLGCEFYDFFGIQGKGQNTKTWEGITRFKKGFNEKSGSIEFYGLQINVLRPIFFFCYNILRKFL